MVYRKSFETLIDIFKSIGTGLFVASMVGFLFRKEVDSWYLLAGSFLSLTISLLLSIIYDRGKGNE